MLGVWNAVEAWLSASRWWAPIGAIVLAILGTVSITIGQDHETKSDWTWIILGAVALLMGALIQLVREIGKANELRSGEQEAIRLRIAMKDALQPVAELIAEMPSKTPKERERALKPVATQCVGALQLLLKDVDRLRAVVYQLGDDEDEPMAYLAYGGRAQKPRPFVMTTERGRLAREMIKTGGSHFEPDIRKISNDAYKGSGRDYQTYISAAICTGGYAYGMVTVDAPRADDLVDTDRQIVCVIADMLGIAFAIADAR